jgi:hypothetical protein
MTDSARLSAPQLDWHWGRAKPLQMELGPTEGDALGACDGMMLRAILLLL